MDNNTHEKSLDRVLGLLREEGFRIVRAEGNPEYLKKLKNYTKTPDLIQYPFTGGGSPNDFFIDVKSPIGNYLERKDTNVGKVLDRSWKKKENLFIKNTIIQKKERQELTESINEKIEKYRRDSSPLFGLVYYFDLRNSKINPIVLKGSERNKIQINWFGITENQRDDFQKEFYLYFIFIPLLDSILGTGLIRGGELKGQEKWGKDLMDVFDKLILRNGIKTFIETKLHSNMSFFILIVDLPNNIKQIVTFYCRPVMRTKIYANNEIIQHMRKLINSASPHSSID